jgi:hypothetical protein
MTRILRILQTEEFVEFTKLFTAAEGVLRLLHYNYFLIVIQ